MENKIDIAAILKDCPRGMELDCAIYDGVTFDCVTIESNCHYNGKNDYPIKIVTKNGFSTRLTKYGQNVDIEEAKCVIFPKGKKTWEGFQRPFKDGDIVCYMDAIAIFKEWGDETLFRTYVATYLYCDSLIDVNTPFYGKSVRKEIRLATEKEKKKLFQAIESNGYKWNEKTKTLAKKPTFKDGDIVADDRGNIAIYKGTMWYNKKLADYYCGYRKSDDKFLIKGYGDGHFGEIEELHCASKEEKQKLFDVIKENGREWDAENKTLVKAIKPEFKDGDILFVDANDDGDDDDRYKYVFIFEEMLGCNKEEIYGRKVMAHCYMTVDGYFKPREVYLIDSTYPIRFATEDEKQKLFQTIEENGYKWDDENKTLEKNLMFKKGDKIKHKENAEWVCTIRRVEDRYYVDGHPTRFTILFDEQNEYELVPNKFDVNTLKTFDQVLVRLTNNCAWMPKLFSHYDTDSKGKYYPFVTIDNIGYPQCIPYNGNEHLRRTTNNCDEFYRIWEK